MTQISTGLNNLYGLGAGVSTHFRITYDSGLSTADGVDRGNGLLAACESDYNIYSAWFPGFSLPFSLPIAVQLVQGGYAAAGWGPPITVQPGNGSKLDLVRYLLVSEVVEMFMKAKANGWGYSFTDGNEGSKGEALSRFLGYRFISTPGLGLDTSVLTVGSSTFFVSNDWLASADRADFVNNNPDDNKPDNVTGCTTLFLYYLVNQLAFSDIPGVINAGAATLGGVYNTLTSDLGDPFPFFKRLVGNAFPNQSTITTGPNFDNPFPMGILSFWVDKSSFGRDEAQDIIDNKSGIVSNAFWLVLEGFSINSFQTLNITIPAPTGSFLGLTDVSINPTPATPGGIPPPNPIPEFEDPTNLKAPQRIRFSFDIKFASLAAFPATGAAPVEAELDAKAQVNSSDLLGAAAVTVFELFGGADPYFSNIDPSNSQDVFYLSQDIRVFPVIAGDSVLSSPAFSTDPYASIQSFLGYLNGNSAYTTPQSTDPLNGLPGQSQYETADSSVFPVDGAGNQVYNFALARVRLRDASLAKAGKVRVFFRLFVAQSCDTDFQPSTTYLSTLGTTGSDLNHPVFPLASGTGLVDPTGQSIQTIPFFATDAAGTHDYDGTVINSNIRDIEIPAGADYVWAYYGCFLDVYDASNNSKFGGTHHCIVAEIAFDDAPIPTTTPIGATPSPANSDKLAQRNLQITSSENPQSAATHIIPQAFDLRPSRPLIAAPNTLLDLPDELMIDWGNTPAGSTASIYWPQLKATDVLTIANEVYSSHLLSAADANTLQCTVTQGVTYIPIPPVDKGIINFAGLFTVNLPSTIKRGQQFNILVRRISSRGTPITDSPPRTGVSTAHPAVGTTPPKQVPAPTLALAPAPPRRASPIFNLGRQTLGAFQVTIPVITKATMLRPEEHTLAVLKWRLQEMSPLYRWLPVVQRYTTLVANRVDGLGGNAGLIPPSLGGAPPTCVEYSGKVAGVVYGASGEFEGFILCEEGGVERRFRGKKGVEEVVRCAWQSGWVVCIVVEGGGDWLSSIILKRPHGHEHRGHHGHHGHE